MPVVFYTSSHDEAVKYAKHPPRTVVTFTPAGIGQRVVDLTSPSSIQLLQTVMVSCGLPPALMANFIALDTTSNTSFEYDMFTVLSTVLPELGMVGAFRRTFSSTLGRPAEEYALFRTAPQQ